MIDQNNVIVLPSYPWDQRSRSYPQLEVFLINSVSYLVMGYMGDMDMDM